MLDADHIEFSIRYHCEVMLREIERFLLIEALADVLDPAEVDVDRAILCILASG